MVVPVLMGKAGEGEDPLRKVLTSPPTTSAVRSNAVFELWLHQNANNLYPSKPQKEAIADQAGLTYSQVTRWFANRRRKVKLSGGRTGSSGSLSSSATSPSAEDVSGDWTEPALQEKEPMSKPELGLGSPDWGLKGLPLEAAPPLPDAALFYAAYMNRLMSLAPFLLPPPASQPLLLTPPALYPPPPMTTPSLQAPAPQPEAPPSPEPTVEDWSSGGGLSEEESIAVSVLASFALQKSARAATLL